MSTIRVGFGNTEIDAAQALLDLCNVRDGATSSYGENRDSLETAQLFLSCLISNVASPLQKPQMAPKVGTVAPMYAVPKGNSVKTEEPVQMPVPRRNSPYQEVPRAHTSARYNQDCNKRSLFKRKPMKHFPTFRPLEAISSSKDESNRQNKKQTRDVGTQTEDLYQLPVIQTMEYTIARLCDKIRTLEAQLKPSTPCNPIGQEDSDYDQDYEDGSDESYKADSDDTSFSDSEESFTDYATPRKSENNIKKKMAETQTLRSTKVLVNRNINANADDMVPLGKGNVMIPAKIFKYINWSSYTSATRKLLTAVFSRRILATHSLTGKPSPAFPNKPAKKKLDPALVNDIVQTVIERCGVPENVVRTSITTKCADESKMYRTREENKRRGKVNRENIPPGTDSDDY